jgi:hypothetical protein
VGATNSSVVLAERLEELEQEADAGADPRATLLLTAWLLLTAAAQLLFLSNWPMYVVGPPEARLERLPLLVILPVAPLPAVLVALVRMGVYAGLAWGILLREPVAWAAVRWEFGRSFLLFIAVLINQGWMLHGALFPAAWAQGLLVGALPALLATNAALATGWRPGPAAERNAALGARLLTAGSVFLFFWMARQPRPVGPPAVARRQALWSWAPVLLITAAEILGAVLTARPPAP